MPNIVAAEFDDFKTADAALRSLHGEGFARTHTTKFYLNAEGQHGRLPMGGDQHADPGTRGAGQGALSGAAIGGAAGLALGLAAAPVVGSPAVIGGLAAGAIAGLLAGALGSLGRGERRPEPVVGRPAGVVVAVFAPTASRRNHAASVLEHHHARAIEEAAGTWKYGTWQDFDPVSIPEWRKPPTP